MFFYRKINFKNLSWSKCHDCLIFRNLSLQLIRRTSFSPLPDLWVYGVMIVGSKYVQLGLNLHVPLPNHIKKILCMCHYNSSLQKPLLLWKQMVWQFIETKQEVVSYLTQNELVIPRAGTLRKKMAHVSSPIICYSKGNLHFCQINSPSFLTKQAAHMISCTLQAHAKIAIFCVMMDHVSFTVVDVTSPLTVWITLMRRVAP